MINYNSDTDINKGNSILLFSTATCNPCKNMKAILSDFEVKHGDKINFYNVDIDLFPVVGEKFNIKSIPTTVFLKDASIKDRFAGFLDDVDLESKMMNLLFNFEAETDFNLDDF